MNNFYNRIKKSVSIVCAGTMLISLCGCGSSNVPVSDGMNHPKDGGAGGIAGHLVYTPTR